MLKPSAQADYGRLIDCHISSSNCFLDIFYINTCMQCRMICTVPVSVPLHGPVPVPVYLYLYRLAVPACHRPPLGGGGNRNRYILFIKE